jgi:hypothetical protein
VHGSSALCAGWLGEVCQAAGAAVCSHPARREKPHGIGVDTNILLRLWPNDDQAQNQRIDALLAVHGATPESLLVIAATLGAALHTLRSAFDQDKAALPLAVRSLLDETAFAFEIALRQC